MALVALVLMLAILQMTPDQLLLMGYQLAPDVGAERWQYASYVQLIGLALVWLLRYGYMAWHRRRLSHSIGVAAQPQLLPFAPYTQVASYTKAPSLVINHSVDLLTPTTTTKFSAFAKPSILPSYFALPKIFKQPTVSGIVPALLTLIAVGLFWSATLCHSVAQRLSAIEQAPTRPLYVNALVTPIGLSDKRLTFEAAKAVSLSSEGRVNLKLNPQKKQVAQGYRQLVRLTNIRPYHSMAATASQQGIIQLDNPFYLANPTQKIPNKNSVSQNKPQPINHSQNTSKTQALSLNAPAKSRLPSSMTVMLQSYRGQQQWLNDLAANQQLTMSLALTPIEFKAHDEVEDFDEYRWLSSRHATAKAKLIHADVKKAFINPKLSVPQTINQQRFLLREHFLALRKQRTARDPQQINPQQGLAVTLSLLTGDRSLISQEMSGLYRFAGISHLLAISGTHVLFLALLCAGIVTTIITCFWPIWYARIPRWQWAFGIAVVVAFGYALFAGFDVPAVRTAFMLLIVGVLRYVLAAPATLKVLLWLAVGMAWVDIFVLWQAGFWLSFIAVAALVAYGQRWQVSPSSRQEVGRATNTGILQRLRVTLKAHFVALFKLQMWMSVALLPLSLWLFGKVSLWGFVINLFAIGLFGWVIVPLNLLAGVLYAAWPSSSVLPDKIWSFLFWLLDGLHQLLFQLQTRFEQVGWLYTELDISLLLLLFMVLLPFLLPKGVLNRLLALAPLSLIAAMSVASTTAQHRLAESQSSATSLDTQAVNIKVLNLNNLQYAATLIYSHSDAWLLLSGYPKAYLQPSPQLTDEQTKQISTALYDQIQRQDIKQLTGVVVQTNTPELAAVVSKLDEYIPLSYYWQAGLNANKTMIQAQMQGSTLLAQNCEANQSWQTQHRSEEGGGWSLTAVTGWPQLNDRQLLDCTLKLSGTQTFWLHDQQDLRALTAKPKRYAQHKAGASLAPSAHNAVIFYSSRQAKLGKLWPLMCEQTDQVLAQHWITPSQAYLAPALIDVFQPLTWHIGGQVFSRTTVKLKDSHLYWQQHYLMSDE